MRTTIDINDTLFREAKAYAAQHNFTFRRLVESALRDALEADAVRQTGYKPPAIPRFAGQGVRSGIDLTDNAALLDAMDAQP